jgi:hypothetical protein
MQKLIIALMYSNREILRESLSELIKIFGEIEELNAEYDFDFTKYYQEEFRDKLLKRFVCFKEPIKKEDLVDIKMQTNIIENRFRVNGDRQINIDPGYLDNDCLVMASNKKMSFKSQLSDGIYAHKLLEFKQGKVITFSHTFPDYNLEENKRFFKIILAKR